MRVILKLHVEEVHQVTASTRVQGKSTSPRSNHQKMALASEVLA
jgi:hypothetical protein